MSINDLIAQLEGLGAETLAKIEVAKDSEELDTLRRSVLGKKGQLQQVLRGIGGVDPKDRPVIGGRANALKKSLSKAVEGRKEALAEAARQADLAKRYVDLSLPGRARAAGAHHPILRVMDEMIDIFARMGFDVARGPQAEQDFFNFEALNFPPDHPARDMQDTLLLEGNRLLRTHTSPVQIRTLLSYEPPVRIIAPGAVYRRDDDITHSPMFYQVEGLHIDRNLHMGHLKGVLTHFAQEVFGPNTRIRLRPSFFPFTEPSAEIDIGCPFCKDGCRVCSHTTWIEILGAGMVDPNVLLSCELDPERWQGWAFGIGVERVAMLKYGIKDIRLFYESNIRFLEAYA